MNFVRLILFGAIGLTAVYVLVSVYSRSIRREKLEKEWQEDHPESTDEAARTRFIEAGMAAYHSGFRRKLILLVYVIPLILITAIHILNTYY